MRAVFVPVSARLKIPRSKLRGIFDSVEYLVLRLCRKGPRRFRDEEWLKFRSLTPQLAAGSIWSCSSAARYALAVLFNGLPAGNQRPAVGFIRHGVIKSAQPVFMARR
jgi:hypothetical protein